jgi:hypothetical protein
MWSVFLVIVNVVFSFIAGAVFAAAIGGDWWLLMFCLGLVLWNIVFGSILLIIGFIISVETVGRGN